MKRVIGMALLAGFLVGAMSGCIVVPFGGGGGYHHHDRYYGH
jgi:hypothetical protein